MIIYEVLFLQISSVAHFLESRGMLEDALEVATDHNYCFDLAVQLGRLEVAKVCPFSSLFSLIFCFNISIDILGNCCRTAK